MKKQKTIGLSYMAYWGDQYEDIASGNNFFLADLVLELNRRKYKIYALQKDLDQSAPKFSGFIPNDRQRAYQMLNFTNDLPQLDILWVEWRWKMEGRNWTNVDGRNKVSADDYYRQLEILEHYHDNTNTKIFIMDSDHKLTEEDETRWHKAKILTLAENPKKLIKDRIHVYWPFDYARIFEQEHMVHEPWSGFRENTYCTDPNFVMSYIGNRYERDQEFDYWIGKVAEELPYKSIHIYGNWAKYPQSFIEIIQRYPRITFHPKVTKSEMQYIYSRSLAVPLLAKSDYNKHGHMTHRLLEVMYCGSIPIGFASFHDIKKYLIDDLIVEDNKNLVYLLKILAQQSRKSRIELWKKQVAHYEYTAGDFINVLESN